MMKMKKTMMLLTMMLVVTLSVNGAKNGVDVNYTVQKIVVVTADRVNVRKQANQQSQRVGSVQQNQTLIVTGESGDWYAVVLNKEPDDWRVGELEIIPGYVMKRFCSEVELEPLTQAKLNNDEESYRFNIINSGRYQGMVIMQDNAKWAATVFVGKIEGNFILFDKCTLQSELMDNFRMDGSTMFLNLNNLSESQTELLISKTAASNKFAIFCIKGKGWEQLYY